MLESVKTKRPALGIGCLMLLSTALAASRSLGQIQQPASASAAASVISSVALTQGPQGPSVRVSGTGLLQVRRVRMHNPERLVLDFAASRLAVKEKVIPADLAPVRAVRLGQYTPEVARVVIDLSTPALYQMAREDSSVVVRFMLPMPELSAGATDHPSAPAASAGRTLLLPRQLVSGEQATLAILDLDGRLTPGVGVNFSNGDYLKTDATGRALFVAPLDPGVLTASIAGVSGIVSTKVVGPPANTSTEAEVTWAPVLASVTDRFNIAGRGFCGEADSNEVTIGGHKALVLTASPTRLAVLPPADLALGQAAVSIRCGKRSPKVFFITFVALTLEADRSPLAPGEHRTVTVRIGGTTSKVALEARNLAADVAELSGGTPSRVWSTGGTENLAHIEVVGKHQGDFLISIRLAPRQLW